MPSSIKTYIFAANEAVVLQMPPNALILGVYKFPASAPGQLTLSALVPTTSGPTVRRLLSVLGADRPVGNRPGAFVGVVVDGSAVWHVFDGGEPGEPAA